MRLDDDRETWSGHVVAAQSGNLMAWSSIIERFEDLAVAAAVGLSGDLDAAADIAQEAFVQAVRRIGSLEDPHAFPAWLLTLVRTANNRHTRRRRLDTDSIDALGPLDDGAAFIADEDPGPEKTALATAETTQVRNAIERLPEGERCVVALHYLAEMPYADVADFLGISVAAAKKRAWSARSRLKELLPVTTDALTAVRPSRNKSFRDTILVFQAIRTGDVELLARLVANDPALANASEDWSAHEGFESNLSFSERATALVRAAGTGDLRLVRVLVEAGARVSGACGCIDQETPLVTAVNIGAADIVEYLVDQGASLDGPAFDGGSTALHVAVHRDDHNLVRLLLAAGADPTLRDRNGRTPADWSVLKTTDRPRPERGDLLWTRIRPIDLFAPLRRGALVHVPPAYGLGAMRTIYGIVDALDAHFWMLGFEHGPYKQREFEQEVSESRTPSTIDLVAPGNPTERRRHFAATLERLASNPLPKIAMVVPGPGHEHDTTIALPSLASDPNVLATIVVVPYIPERPDISDAIPEGFDARIAFDRTRANLRIWPAIDPTHTNARDYPAHRHEQIATAARETLTAYAAIDPQLDLPDPRTLNDTALAERAQQLLVYLAHAFRPFEHLAAAPAADTSIDQLLRTIEDILGR